MEQEHSLLLIEREIQAISNLNASIDVLEDAAFDQETIDNIIQAKIFTPEQDRVLADWFARFLSLKQNIWAVLDNAIEVTGGVSKVENGLDDKVWAYFLIGYSAVCSSVRLDYFLLNTLAYDSIFQRKLNEGYKEYRIKRKQWTAVYRALTLPSNSFKIIMAHKAFKRHHLEIDRAIKNLSLKGKSRYLLDEIYQSIPEQEKHLNLRWYRCLWQGLNYRYHSWRRRNASFKQQSTHALLEYGGRIVSELKLPTEKRVSQQIKEQIRLLLRPGDILITRHNGALTNLFLPGFWPHAALYIGNNSQQFKHNKEFNSEEPPLTNSHFDEWVGNICTFEALKDGVHFRTLEATLSVDAFVVLRPNLPQEAINEAISRAILHAGKGYNFDFDLFRSDQLVCTEVIYRAYDGIKGTNIPLTERLGKKTLSAEDLLDFSINEQWATPIAIYGTEMSENAMIIGDNVKPVLIDSYRHNL